MLNHFGKDYITNKQNLLILATKIEDYWMKQGCIVDVWVETIPVYGANGERLTTRYELASDIKQRVPQYA